LLRKLEFRLPIEEWDLVQEALFKAHRHFHGFRGASEPELLGWLSNILSQACIDYQRQYRPGGKRDPAQQKSLTGHRAWESRSRRAPCTSSILADLTRQEEFQGLRRAIALLPADYRRVVEARVFEDQSWDECGAHVGRTAEAARKMFHRAANCMKKTM
jgi:RNA polymerase sigma-70 factor (ECF subfamily)